MKTYVNLTADNVKVISLKNLTDRHNKFISDFKESTIPYSFEYEKYIKLVSNNQTWHIETPNLFLNFPIDLFKKTANREEVLFSELAITVMHCNVYKMFLDSKEKFLVLFEDDIKPCINKEKLEFLIFEFLKTNLDMLYLQSDCPWQHIPKNFLGATFNPVTENLIDITSTYDFSGLSAYCLSRQGAEKILNFYINNGVFQIIDSAIGNMAHMGILQVCAYKNYDNVFKLSGFETTHRNHKLKVSIK